MYRPEPLASSTNAIPGAHRGETRTVRVFEATFGEPSPWGDALVQRGALMLACGTDTPRRIVCLVRGETRRIDADVHLLLAERPGGPTLSLDFSALAPRLTMAQPGRLPIALGFGWGEDDVTVDGRLLGEAEETCRWVLGSPAAHGLSGEAFAALDLAALACLFAGDEGSGFRLLWPDRPRRCFHWFVGRLARRAAG
jgi:hypothetical protein